MADCAEAAPVDEAGAGGGEQQDDAVDAPLVFQCKGCMAIVGDSFSWACSDEGGWHYDMNSPTCTDSRCR